MTAHNGPAHPAPSPDPTFVSLREQLTAVERAYREIDELCTAQTRSITDQDTGTLLDIIEKRQRLVAELQSADAGFIAITEAWNRGAVRCSSDERGWVCGQFEVIAVLADKIARSDREALERLRTDRDSIAAELAGLSKSRTANTAYAEPAAIAPRFQDREA